MFECIVGGEGGGMGVEMGGIEVEVFDCSIGGDGGGAVVTTTTNVWDELTTAGVTIGAVGPPIGGTLVIFA